MREINFGVVVRFHCNSNPQPNQEDLYDLRLVPWRGSKRTRNIVQYTLSVKYSAAGASVVLLWKHLYV